MSSTASGAPKWAIGDKVLALAKHKYYEAKVKLVQTTGEKPEYKIHYNGWNDKFDEFVTGDRLMDPTPENLAMARAHNADIDAQLASSKSAKKAKSSSSKPRDSVGGAAGGAGEGAPLSGHKRKIGAVRESEDDGASAAAAGLPLLKFSFPPNLKKVVVEEWGLVTQKKMLPRLPRPEHLHTFDSVVQGYILHMGAVTAEKLVSAKGGMEAAVAAVAQVVAAAARSLAASRAVDEGSARARAAKRSRKDKDDEKEQGDDGDEEAAQGAEDAAGREEKAEGKKEKGKGKSKAARKSKGKGDKDPEEGAKDSKEDAESLPLDAAVAELQQEAAARAAESAAAAGEVDAHFWPPTASVLEAVTRGEIDASAVAAKALSVTAADVSAAMQGGVAGVRTLAESLQGVVLSGALTVAADAMDGSHKYFEQVAAGQLQYRFERLAMDALTVVMEDWQAQKDALQAKAMALAEEEAAAAAAAAAAGEGVAIKAEPGASEEAAASSASSSAAAAGGAGAGAPLQAAASSPAAAAVDAFVAFDRSHPLSYAKLFGPEFLLRFFIKLPELMAVANVPMTDDERGALVHAVNHFLAFMSKSAAHVFPPRESAGLYRRAPLEYVDRFHRATRPEAASSSSSGASKREPTGSIRLPLPQDLTLAEARKLLELPA